MYTISEAAALLGVTVLTLRRWDKRGKLVPSVRTSGGHRRYTLKDLSKIKDVIVSTKYTIAYCRVPNMQHKEDLNIQIKNVTKFCDTKKYNFQILTDIGNATDYARPGFINLLHMIQAGLVDRVIMNYRDSLVSEGYEIFVQVCEFHNVSLEILQPTKGPYSHDELEILAPSKLKQKLDSRNKSRTQIERLVK